MDPPFAWGHAPARLRRLGPSCHLVSDTPGAGGQEELHTFAARLGMRRAWFQKEGTEHEHYDLFGARIDRAKALGALLVDRRQLVTIFRLKRAFLQSQSQKETATMSKSTVPPGDTISSGDTPDTPGTP